MLRESEARAGHVATEARWRDEAPTDAPFVFKAPALKAAEMVDALRELEADAPDGPALTHVYVVEWWADTGRRERRLFRTMEAAKSEQDARGGPVNAGLERLEVGP